MKDWLLDKFIDDGVKLEVIGRSGDMIVYHALRNAQH
jgi:hypothetical protein